MTGFLDTSCQFISRFFNLKTMRSIQTIYKKIQDKNPDTGAYLLLARSVLHKKFARKNLVQAFNKIVPKDDYDKSDRFELINHLEYLTNLPLVEVEI